MRCLRGPWEPRDGAARAPLRGGDPESGGRPTHPPPPRACPPAPRRRRASPSAPGARRHHRAGNGHPRPQTAPRAAGRRPDLAASTVTQAPLGGAFRGSATSARTALPARRSVPAALPVGHTVCTALPVKRSPPRHFRAQGRGLCAASSPECHRLRPLDQRGDPRPSGSAPGRPPGARCSENRPRGSQPLPAQPPPEPRLLAPGKRN